MQTKTIVSKRLPEAFAAILGEELVFSLATIDERGEPWACNCYFVFLESPKPGLIFASSQDSKHAKNFMLCPCVAGTVAHAEARPSHIRGLQLKGQVSRVAPKNVLASKAYLQRFSYATEFGPLQLWEFSIQFAKLTDNRIHFGYKQSWEFAQ